MKIIESKPNINWRNIKSNVEIQNVIKEFDELLNNESFNGLKKINSRLNLKNFRKLKVSKKEFEECSNYLSDDEKFSLYEAIKNISFVFSKFKILGAATISAFILQFKKYL